MKTTFHAIRRTQERVLNLNTVNVGFECGFGGNYEIVGTIDVAQATKNEFKANLDKLQGMNVGTKNMVVQLTRMDLRPSNITWKNQEAKKEAQGKNLTVCGDRDKIEGNGDVAWAFVVKGVLTTIITVKNYMDIARKFEKVNGSRPIVVKNLNKFKIN